MSTYGEFVPYPSSAPVAANKGVGPEPAFDPMVHLGYQSPAERLTMSQLGLGHVATPSPIGVTSPFPLASLEGVVALRNSLLQPAVLEHHVTASALAGPHAQLRGMAPHAAKFLYEFWTHPETLRSLCEAAGEDLIPVFDLELGHTNVQVPSHHSRESYLKTLHPDPFQGRATTNSASSDEGVTTASSSSSTAAGEEDEENLVVGFHQDAYPWVAVLMLSDVSSMIGGETALRLGSGELFKARGPNLGSCVMLQGGYISHAALPCKPNPLATSSLIDNERITMVTSFRKRSAFGWRDVSNLTNIRSCSNWNELYAQWVASRLTMVEEKVQGLKQIMDSRRRESERKRGGGELAKIGGLKDPVIWVEEVQRLRAEIMDHLDRAGEEMLPYGHESDHFTPQDNDPAKSNL